MTDDADDIARKVARAGDDAVLPFHVVGAGARGRIVRLGTVVDEIITRHAYPEPVSRLLGEAVALTALLGATIKVDGKLIVQTSTDGPVSLLVADYVVPGQVRGYARFDAEKVAALEAEERAQPAVLMGHGHLAMTLEKEGESERYQGIVALDGDDLTEAAHTYFRDSEQIPSFVRLAVARIYQAGEGGAHGTWGWRAAGLMIQDLAAEGGHGPQGDADGWNRAQILAGSAQDHELLDPRLPPENLLYRLFHEDEVRVFAPTPMKNYCRCSRQRIEGLLDRFSPDDLGDMVEDDGRIKVTCEFCNRTYLFDAEDVG